MIPPDNFNSLMRSVMKGMSGDPDINGKKEKANSNTGNKLSNNNKQCLDPSSVLIIAGLLGGVLEVDSILLSKDQDVEIVLVGSLKRKTELDEMLEQIGSLSFETVMKAILDNFS